MSWGTDWSWWQPQAAWLQQPRAPRPHAVRPPKKSGAPGLPQQQHNGPVAVPPKKSGLNGAPQWLQGPQGVPSKQTGLNGAPQWLQGPQGVPSQQTGLFGAPQWPQGPQGVPSKQTGQTVPVPAKQTLQKGGLPRTVAPPVRPRQGEDALSPSKMARPGSSQGIRPPAVFADRSALDVWKPAATPPGPASTFGGVWPSQMDFQESSQAPPMLAIGDSSGQPPMHAGWQEGVTRPMVGEHRPRPPPGAPPGAPPDGPLPSQQSPLPPLAKPTEDEVAKADAFHQQVATPSEEEPDRASGIFEDFKAWLKAKRHEMGDPEPFPGAPLGGPLFGSPFPDSGSVVGSGFSDTNGGGSSSSSAPSCDNGFFESYFMYGGLEHVEKGHAPPPGHGKQLVALGGPKPPPSPPPQHLLLGLTGQQPAQRMMIADRDAAWPSSSGHSRKRGRSRSASHERHRARSASHERHRARAAPRGRSQERRRSSGGGQAADRRSSRFSGQDRRDDSRQNHDRRDDSRQNHDRRDDSRQSHRNEGRQGRRGDSRDDRNRSRMQRQSSPERSRDRRRQSPPRYGASNRVSGGGSGAPRGQGPPKGSSNSRGNKNRDGIFKELLGDGEAKQYDPAWNPEALEKYGDRLQEVDVEIIRHTHDEVQREFANGPHKGQSVEDLIRDMIDGKVKPHDLTPIVTIKNKGLHWAVFGNRRVKVLKEFAKHSRTPVTMKAIVWDGDLAPSALTAKLIHAGTTKNSGTSAKFASTSGKGGKGAKGRSKGR